MDVEPDLVIDRDTLDEKISDTLKRDMTMIIHKIEYVLRPRSVAESHKQLRNCYYNLI